MVAADGIDVFHGNGTFTGFVRALQAALGSHPWDILQVHNPHLGALLSVARLTLGRRRLPPLVITVHNSYGVFGVKHRLMYLPAFARFDGIVHCSNACLASFPAFYRWLGRGRVTAIQNGVDLARVDRATASRPAGDFTVVTAARLVAVKRLDTALRAFACSAGKTSRLVLVGAGPLRQALADEAARMRVEEQIEFTGLVARNEALARMKAADLFISTSAGEGLPVSALEAMACRLPVVLSDIPPHREIAGNDPMIPLVAPGDVVAFAREIARFQAMPPEERRDIGERCRRAVESRFSLARMLAAYDREYERVTRARFARG